MTFSILAYRIMTYIVDYKYILNKKMYKIISERNSEKTNVVTENGIMSKF